MVLKTDRGKEVATAIVADMWLLFERPQSCQHYATKPDPEAFRGLPVICVMASLYKTQYK